MTTHAVSPVRRRRLPPRAVWIRFGVFAALLLVGFALVRWTPLGELLTREAIAATVRELRETWWSPILLIGLYTTLTPLGLPPAPLLVGGAVFGPILGTAYNTAGLMIGAALSYQLASRLGRDFVLHLAGTRLKRAERLFHRHGFWPLVQTRFLPLPFPVVNFGAALAGVRPSRFLLATILGIVPSTLLHTFFISQLLVSEGRQRWLMLYGYAASFLVFNLAIGLPWLRQRRRRRRRYRELLERRAARTGV